MSSLRLRFLRPDKEGCYERVKPGDSPPAPRKVSLVLVPPEQNNDEDGRLSRWRSVPFSDLEGSESSWHSLKMRVIRRSSNVEMFDNDVQPTVLHVARRNTTVAESSLRRRNAQGIKVSIAKKLSALALPKPRPFPRLIFDPCSSADTSNESLQLETSAAAHNYNQHLFDSIAHSQCTGFGAARTFSPDPSESPLFPDQHYNTTAPTDTGGAIASRSGMEARPASPVATLVGKWESLSRTQTAPVKSYEAKHTPKKGLSALMSKFKAMASPRRDPPTVVRATPKVVRPTPERAVDRPVFVPRTDPFVDSELDEQPQQLYAPIVHAVPSESSPVPVAEPAHQAYAAPTPKSPPVSVSSPQHDVQLPPSPPIAVRVREEEDKSSPPSAVLVREEEDKSSSPSAVFVREKEDKSPPPSAVLVREEEDKSSPPSSVLVREEEDKPSPPSSVLVREEEDKLLPPSTAFVGKEEDKPLPPTSVRIREEEDDMEVSIEPAPDASLDLEEPGPISVASSGFHPLSPSSSGAVNIPNTLLVPPPPVNVTHPIEQRIDSDEVMMSVPSSRCVTESLDPSVHEDARTNSFNSLVPSDLTCSYTVTLTQASTPVQDPSTSMSMSSSFPSSLDLQEQEHEPRGPFRPASAELKESLSQENIDKSSPVEEEYVHSDDDIASRVDEPRPVASDNHLIEPPTTSKERRIPRPLPEFMERAHHPDEAPPPSPAVSVDSDQPLPVLPVQFAPPLPPTLPTPPVGTPAEATPLSPPSPPLTPRSSMDYPSPRMSEAKAEDVPIGAGASRSNSQQIATPKLAWRRDASHGMLDSTAVEDQSGSLPAIYAGVRADDDAISALSSEDEAPARALVVRDAAARLARAYKMLDNRGVKRAYLCTNVDLRYNSRISPGWECGHLAAAALVASLQHDPVAGPALRAAGLRAPPESDDIARRIEDAWAAGFDTAGATRYAGRLVGRHAYLGATEVAVLLVAAGVDARARKFETQSPRLRRIFFEWILEYFQSGCIRAGGCALNERRKRSTVEPAPMQPLFVQWRGRSLLVVGAEKTRRGDIRALVFEPTAAFADALEARGVKARVAAARRGENHPMWAEADEFHVVFVEQPDAIENTSKQLVIPPRRISRMMRKSANDEAPSNALTFRWGRRARV